MHIAQMRLGAERVKPAMLWRRCARASVMLQAKARLPHSGAIVKPAGLCSAVSSPNRYSVATVALPRPHRALAQTRH